MDLAAAVREAGIGLDPDAAGVLERYLAAVHRMGERRNLTAARTPEALLEVLVLPSLLLAGAWEGPPPRRVVDVGSGNGFPGVVACALWPTSRVMLVERRLGKAEAIREALVAAAVTNAEVVALDAREIPRRRPDLLRSADLVTFRAVGPLAECNRLAAPLLAPGGRVLHWKARDLGQAERADGDRGAVALGLVRLSDYVPPGLLRGRIIRYGVA